MAKLDMTALTKKAPEVEVLPPEKVEVLPAVPSGKSLVSRSDNGFVSVLSSAISMPIAIFDGLLSTANHLIDAYAEIQRSHDQVKIAQAQAAAYIRGREEETRQVAITQENETIRFLEKCRTDLEIQRLEYEKFALEISERREARLIQQERWQKQMDFLQKYADNLLRRIEEVQTLYAVGGFQNETLRNELRYADEKMLACLEQIRALSI